MAIKDFIPGFRLIDGSALNTLVAAINNLTGSGTPAAVTGTTGAFSGAVTGGSVSAPVLSTTGTETATPQILTAAGATQGAATAIAKSLAIITVCTASARGVKLPAAVTGLMVRVISLCTQGTKVYPSTGDRVGLAATNVAVVLAGLKGNIYAAKDATTWAVLKGA